MPQHCHSVSVPRIEAHTPVPAPPPPGNLDGVSNSSGSQVSMDPLRDPSDVTGHTADITLIAPTAQVSGARGLGWWVLRVCISVQGPSLSKM